MERERVGRNDPCPCGSGRKYKHCCLLKDRRAAQPNAAKLVNEELRQLIRDRRFATNAELQAFIDQEMVSRNTRPIDDFEGLSPGQMQKLLHRPFEAPDVVVIPEVLRTSEPEAPALELLIHLLRAMGDDGLKATARGNLPRAFCREAAASYFREERHHFDLLAPDPAKLSSEEQFRDLLVVRYVARAAGLIRLHRKTYLPTKRALDLLDRHGAAGLYPVLLRAFVTELDWSSMDGFPPLGIVQQSWAFTTFLLRRYGATPREATFYSDAFLKAYPLAVEVAQEELEGTGWLEWHGEPEEAARGYVQRTYRTRALHRFAAFLGLARLELRPGSSRLDDTYRVSSTPLLGDAIRFRIGSAST